MLKGLEFYTRIFIILNLRYYKFKSRTLNIFNILAQLDCKRKHTNSFVVAYETERDPINFKFQGN